ncbi:MAG: hypothetical protein LBL71_04290 [Endomicrobium sp.]|nr:hypothetical protein [Endomicrobium sp.]
MRILREITAVSLVFLSVFMSVQEVIGEKVKIGFVNNKEFFHGNWRLADVGIRTFESEDHEDRDFFKSFVKAAKDNGIMKIMKLPDPPPDFTPVGNINSHLPALDYLDLVSGEYRYASFGRSDTFNFDILDIVSFSVKHLYTIWYFEVEANEAAAINNKLLFCPYPGALASLEPTPCMWISGNGFVIGGVIVALVTSGIVGTELYLRQNRKKEEERKKMEMEKLGFLKRLLTRMNLKIID